jgi:GntR family transcriptional regulator/MocR family aminotransferase
MKRPPEGLGPVVALDRRQGRPLHRQLYDGYREAILEGRLRPGQRLPSTRSLADDLQISRIPAVMAFEQLVAEGYVESRVGAGSFVSTALPDPKPDLGRRAPVPRRTGPRHLPPTPLEGEAEPWLELRGPFRASLPALEEFPADLWARLVARHAQRLSPRQMAYGDPMGLLALREALADHLSTVRSVNCSPEQIMIVSGSQQALALCGQVLLAPGDKVWLEEPGYPGARDALRLAGARIVPAPVDDDGLDVDATIDLCPDARAAYVTPSHQFPLGGILGAARRIQLLDWAARRGAWVLEDDYDSEYRYTGQPLASLQGLDTDARVLYIGTFSKVLFPALRIGYMVLPRDLVERFRRVRLATDIHPAPFHQAVLAELIAEGHFARHLRRMRGLYGERRRALDAALARELGTSVRVVGDQAGMHLVALLPAGSRDREVAIRAARRGVSVIPLSSCYLGRRKQPGLILGYGSTRVAEIPDAVRKLKAILRG